MALAKTMILPLAMAARISIVMENKSETAGTCSYSCGAKKARASIDEGQMVDFHVGLGSGVQYVRNSTTCLSNCFVLQSSLLKLHFSKACPSSTQMVAAKSDTLRTLKLCCQELSCHEAEIGTPARRDHVRVAASATEEDNDKCLHPCGARLVTGNIGSQLINFLIGSGTGVDYQRSDDNCLGECVAHSKPSRRCEQLFPGSIKVSVAAFENGFYKLCCKPKTCSTSNHGMTDAEEIMVNGSRHRFSCENGQGLPFATYYENEANTFTDCASLCAKDSKCSSLDYSKDKSSAHFIAEEMRWQQDACRLYKTADQRDDNSVGFHKSVGFQSRQFCKKLL